MKKPPKIPKLCTNGIKRHTWGWWIYSEVGGYYYSKCERMGCHAEKRSENLVPRVTLKRRR